MFVKAGWTHEAELSWRRWRFEIEDILSWVVFDNLEAPMVQFRHTGYRMTTKVC